MRQGLIAIKRWVKGKGKIHQRTYWLKPTTQASTPAERPSAPAPTEAPARLKGKKLGTGAYEYKHKGHVIRVVSENMHKSRTNTKNPKQMWSASVDGQNGPEGFGSREGAVAAAVSLIELRNKRQAQS